MNASAIRKLRSQLNAGNPVCGMWVTLESPSITEMGVALGLDWIVIDAEHGHLDWKEIVEHLRAAVRSDTVMLVRIAEDNQGTIKRALDIGADGILIPRVESAGQLREIVRMVHYPPRGIRGIGAERATCWGQCFSEHVREANEHALIIPLIETEAAVENLAEMLKVQEVEMFWFGPADHSASAGYAGQWEGLGIAQQILESLSQINAVRKYAGIIVRDDRDLVQRHFQGFRLLGLGMDAGFIIASLRRMLLQMGKDVRFQTSLQPMNVKQLVETSKQRPLESPPEGFRPDRQERIALPGEGPQIELEHGIRLDCLVGVHNGAQNLTTGLVSFQRGSVLSYHSHTCGETVTVIEGTLLFEVEGRRYMLEKLDNITIPAGLAHKSENISSETVVAHVALATSKPDREPITDKFRIHVMRPDESAPPGKEWVVRFKLARRYAAGSNTEFIDHLNGNMIPGIEMSGGYGLFHHGGRLPAHIHDFDESICIIQGTAICNVEGRRYTMANYQTALQPRGRIHYFANESQEPMVMLWVYAGPLPERIMMAESLTKPEANPWNEHSPLQTA